VASAIFISTLPLCGDAFTMPISAPGVSRQGARTWWRARCTSRCNGAVVAATRD